MSHGEISNGMILISRQALSENRADPINTKPIAVIMHHLGIHWWLCSTDFFNAMRHIGAYSYAEHTLPQNQRLLITGCPTT